MPPNTQFTAYGNSSFIFNGGEGRFSSSAAAGGAGGGLGIATGAEGATSREERGSSEEGGAHADIGRGGRSTCGLAGIDRGSRRVEIANRARSCGREIEIKIAGIENFGDRLFLFWEAGWRRRRRAGVLLPGKTSRFWEDELEEEEEESESAAWPPAGFFIMSSFFFLTKINK